MSEACELAQRNCVPCRGGVPPLSGDGLVDIAARLGSDWRVVDEHHLEREYSFRNFRDALSFVNRVGGIAEEQGHHPDLELGWGRAKVVLYTHKIDGLTESDFVMAAKIEQVAGTE